MDKGELKETLIKYVENRDLALAKFEELWQKDYLMSLKYDYNNYKNSYELPPYLKVGSIFLQKHLILRNHIGLWQLSLN